jgi:hypothetical protein
MKKQMEYVPGVCNIGPAERRIRRRAGWFGLGATVLLWSVLLYLQAPSTWRVLLFFPAVAGAVGFLQDAFHFCAAFGLLGVFNTGSGFGKTESVEQAEFRRKDRQKALLIILYSVWIGLAVAAAGYLLEIPR